MRDVGGPADLDEILPPQANAPMRVRYRRGDEPVEEEFAEIDRSRGGGLAELRRGDGSYVTVDVRQELDAIEVR